MSSVDNFEKEIMEALEDIRQNTEEAIFEVTEETAKEALESLKNNKNIPVRTGEYKRSFYLRRKKQKDRYVGVIANKVYQLTHLLEYGHANSGFIKGGGRTKAHPHWGDAERVAAKLSYRIREKMMENGTRKVKNTAK